MKRMLAVALLLVTTGCIDVPAMNGLMDRLVPEPEVIYQEVELERFEGQFAPDPDQDNDAVLDAAQKILDDPAQIGAVVQNLSWVEYTHRFLLPPGATKLMVKITIDYTLLVGPNEGPAGEQKCRDERDPPCFEIVYFGGGEKEIDGSSTALPPVPGEWTVTISGSGMEGLIGELIYSGNYKLVVPPELPVS